MLSVASLYFSQQKKKKKKKEELIGFCSIFLDFSALMTQVDSKKSDQNPSRTNHWVII